MKKLIIFLPILAFTLFAFTNIERGTDGDSPGVIQAIGNAGSNQIFTFKKWKYTAFEMPEDNVENIALEIEINTSSARCDWKDLQKNVLKKKDYFYVKKFPKAMIKINGAETIDDGKYRTNALLTLKGIEKKVELTFSISETKPYKVQGEGVVMRREFDFSGNGPADEVPIKFDIVLPEF